MRSSAKKFFYKVIEHKIFQFGLTLKAIYGTLETAGGIILTMSALDT